MNSVCNLKIWRWRWSLDGFKQKDQNIMHRIHYNHPTNVCTEIVNDLSEASRRDPSLHSREKVELCHRIASLHDVESLSFVEASGFSVLIHRHKRTETALAAVQLYRGAPLLSSRFTANAANTIRCPNTLNQTIQDATKR